LDSSCPHWVGVDLPSSVHRFKGQFGNTFIDISRNNALSAIWISPNLIKLTAKINDYINYRSWQVQNLQCGPVGWRCRMSQCSSSSPKARIPSCLGEASILFWSDLQLIGWGPFTSQKQLTSSPSIKCWFHPKTYSQEHP
jgi:hypothetical protein